MQLSHCRPTYTSSKTPYLSNRIFNWQPEVANFCPEKCNLKSTLSNICELANFPYGEIWFPNPENDLLEFSPIYHLVPSDRQDDLEHFYDCSQGFIVSKGEGLTGRVWLKQQPEWILDVSAKSEGYFSRNQIAGVFGVQTGFAIPVVLEEKVLMVMAFFACELRPYSAQLLSLAMDSAIKSHS